MTKYICAVEAADKLSKHFDIPLVEFVDIMAEVSTVDAVPVVRCRECKYYKPDEYQCGCDCPAGLPYVKADDYCSYGQRRDQSADVRNMDGGGADAP